MKKWRIRCLELIVDDSGKLSVSRVLLFVCIISYLWYAGVIVWHTRAIPDMPLNLAGLCALLYGVNKFSPTTPFTGGQQ